MQLISGAWWWRLNNMDHAGIIGNHIVPPEFEMAQDSDEDFFWLVYLEAGWLNPATGEYDYQNGSVEAGTADELRSKVFSANRSGILLVNVSKIVRDVNKRLIEAGYSID